jgi:DNA-binding HxlR family transcriptional regulator
MSPSRSSRDQSAPHVGSVAGGSAAGRPIASLLDLLGRRWALRILWELRDGPLRFVELQRRCDAMSASVLTQRLRELAANAIVTTTDDGSWTLTSSGYALCAPIESWQTWSATWARQRSRRGRQS